MRKENSTTKKVQVIFNNDIVRKPSIIFDERLRFRVLNKVDNIPTLNELI